VSGPAGSTEGPVTLRLRRAQDPPRLWSPVDAFLYNVVTTNVAVLIGLPLLAGARFFYQTSSIAIATLVVGAFCVLEAVTYAFLVSSLPRDGGDYVFQSRLFSGAVGAVFALTGTAMGGALWVGISGWFASRVVIGPFVALVAFQTGQPVLHHLARWIMSPAGVVGCGLAVIAWSALLTTRSMATYARVQRIAAVAGVVCLVILTAYFATTRLSVNVSIYRSVLYRALEVGYRHGGHEEGWRAALGLIPFVAFGLIYPGWAAYQSAEVRGAGHLRSQAFVIVGSKLVMVALALVVLTLPLRHAGEELFASSAYLALHDPESFWVLAPRLFGLREAPWLSVVILVVLAAGLNTWFWLWAPTHALAASRVMLAMSWDRLLPRWFAKLDPRTGTPSRCVATFSVACLLVLPVAAVVGPVRLAVDGTLVYLAMFAMTCVAAALFPFVRRERYRDSTAASLEVGGIPLISLAALGFLAFCIPLAFAYVRLEVSAGGPAALDMVFLVVAPYVAAALLYAFLRSYRRRREGADVDLYFRDLPPSSDVTPHPFG